MPAKKTNKSEAPKPVTVSKKSVKPVAKKESPVSKKVAPKKTKKTSSDSPLAAASKNASAAIVPVNQTPVISIEEIQLRAYYISERRQTMGWPGNASTDWIEAESQLVAEAKRRLKNSI